MNFVFDDLDKITNNNGNLAIYTDLNNIPCLITTEENYKKENYVDINLKFAIVNNNFYIIMIKANPLKYYKCFAENISDDDVSVINKLFKIKRLNLLLNSGNGIISIEEIKHREKKQISTDINFKILNNSELWSFLENN